MAEAEPATIENEPLVPGFVTPALVAWSVYPLPTLSTVRLLNVARTVPVFTVDEVVPPSVPVPPCNVMEMAGEAVPPVAGLPN
jgi:hypothetical protein